MSSSASRRFRCEPCVLCVQPTTFAPYTAAPVRQFAYIPGWIQNNIKEDMPLFNEVITGVCVLIYSHIKRSQQVNSTWFSRFQNEPFYGFLWQLGVADHARSSSYYAAGLKLLDRSCKNWKCINKCKKYMNIFYSDMFITFFILIFFSYIFIYFQFTWIFIYLVNYLLIIICNCLQMYLFTYLFGYWPVTNCFKMYLFTHQFVNWLLSNCVYHSF